MQEIHTDIQREGGTLIAISPQLQKYSKQVVTKNKLSFPVLIDPENKLAQQLKICFTFPAKLQEIYKNLGIDLARFNGNEDWTLPLVGRMIIDSKGIIRNAEFSESHTQRPNPAAILPILQSL